MNPPPDEPPAASAGAVPTVSPPIPLAARLFVSGQRFLVAAITAYTRDERDVFALHAGVAVEHLVKARLVAINPLLNFDPTTRSDDAPR